MDPTWQPSLHEPEKQNWFPLHGVPEVPHLQAPPVQVSVVPEHAGLLPHLQTPPVQVSAAPLQAGLLPQRHRNVGEPPSLSQKLEAPLHSEENLQPQAQLELVLCLPHRSPDWSGRTHLLPTAFAVQTARQVSPLVVLAPHAQSWLQAQHLARDPAPGAEVQFGLSEQ